MLERITRKFLSIWRTPRGIGQRAVRSGAIVYFEKFVLKGMAFVRTVIVARLLLPEQIGLFGLAILSVSFTTIFFQPGLSQAVVQERGDVRKYLNSAWTVNLFLKLFLAVLLFFVAAPLAGDFFHDPRVVPLARALSLMLVLQGIENVGMAMLIREMRFNRLFIYDVIGYGSQWIITIFAAIILRNPWALVIGTIFGHALFVLLSYRLHEYRPRLSFDFSGARHLFRYGKWVGIGGILGFLISQGDNLTIGRMLDAESLAFYLTAYSLGTLPATEIVGVIGGILFPLYANLQGDVIRLKHAFVRIARLAFSISIPASFGLAVLAPEAVKFVYGPRWLPMVPILYVILAYGLFKAFELLINPLFRGIGKPQVSTGIMALQAAVMFALIVPFIKMWGSVGAGLAVLAGFSVALVAFIMQLRKNIPIGFGTLLQITGMPIIAALGMSALLWEAKHIVPIATNGILGLYIVLGALLYFALLLAVDSLTGKKWWSTVSWVRGNL